MIRMTVLVVIPLLVACSLAPDHCLRMSDCGDGTTCVEGVCVGGPPAELTSSPPDSSAAAPASTSPATARDAGMQDAARASDASDGALTDAPSDG